MDEVKKDIVVEASERENARTFSEGNSFVKFQFSSQLLSFQYAKF